MLRSWLGSAMSGDITLPRWSGMATPRPVAERSRNLPGHYRLGTPRRRGRRPLPSCTADQHRGLGSLKPDPCHADQAGAALVLPDRLAADQPLGPVRTCTRLLRGLWSTPWHNRETPGRWKMVGRGAAGLARRQGPAGFLVCRDRERAGADDQGRAGGSASRP